MLDLELEPRIFNSSSPETFPQKITNKGLENPQTGHLENKQKKQKSIATLSNVENRLHLGMPLLHRATAFLQASYRMQH